MVERTTFEQLLRDKFQGVEKERALRIMSDYGPDRAEEVARIMVLAEEQQKVIRVFAIFEAHSEEHFKSSRPQREKQEATDMLFHLMQRDVLNLRSSLH